METVLSVSLLLLGGWLLLRGVFHVADVAGRRAERLVGGA